MYVTIQLPARGEYGLEIYANEPDREGDTFTHVCQYLASFIDRDPGSVYGQVYDKQDFAYGQASGAIIYPGHGGRHGPMYADSPEGSMRSMPGQKQVYSNSSSEWSGNTLTQQSFRQESEAIPGGGIRTVTHTQVNHKSPISPHSNLTMLINEL